MANDRPRSTAPKKGGSSGSQGRAKSAQPAKKSAATQRFAERQARKQAAALEARRARNRRWGLISIIVVIAIVAALVIVKVAGSGGGGGNATADQPSPPKGNPIAPATLQKMQSIPISTMAAAPTTGILSQIQPTNGKALTSGGKPELLYVGAEFCPYCAAQRWALYVALSKFGTFSPDPGKIHSATLDGNVPTMTFYGTTYSSPYFSFTPLELYTNMPAANGNGYTQLQVPTQTQFNLFQSLGGGSYPFIDFAGKEYLSGSQYSYASMQNKAFATVAAQVGNNSTTIGADVNAGSYLLIKSICRSLSGHQPTAVCSAAGA
jgi:Domain of unknown function (DUF929)